MKGKADFLEGKFDEAIDSYDKCIRSQSDLKQIQHASCWEMTWCYA